MERNYVLYITRLSELFQPVKLKSNAHYKKLKYVWILQLFGKTLHEQDSIWLNNFSSFYFDFVFCQNSRLIFFRIVVHSSGPKYEKPFSKKFYAKCGGEASPRPFSKNQNWSSIVQNFANLSQGILY